MELTVVNQNRSDVVIMEENVVTTVTERTKNPFIEANTQQVTFEHLKQETIIPVFSKDNELTISHPEFIEATQKAVLNAFPIHELATPDIRVSHVIKGRTPGAIGKPAKELLSHEKTIYYERMAFVIEIPEVQQIVNGNRLSLVVGGVRAYNTENLYSKKSIEKFRVFIGFENQICTNLCISTDGYKDELRVTNTTELQSNIEALFLDYNYERHLGEMERFSKFSLTTEQFAHMLGRMKMFMHLDLKKKGEIFYIAINDTHINTIAKNYYKDNHFKSEEDGAINLWNLYNLMTGAVKSSYIDSFLKRECNCFEFVQMLTNTFQNEETNYYMI